MMLGTVSTMAVELPSSVDRCFHSVSFLYCGVALSDWRIREAISVCLEYSLNLVRRVTRKLSVDCFAVQVMLTCPKGCPGLTTRGMGHNKIYSEQ